MEDKEGPGTDGSWTKWKTLHHQTADLSPWMTEAVKADLGRNSPETGSIVHPSESSNEIRVNVARKSWKLYAFIAAILLILILIFVLVFALKDHPGKGPAPLTTSTPVVPVTRVQGIATFNDYSAQEGTVCSIDKKPTTADNVKRFAAAAGDISKDISSGMCESSHLEMDFAYDTSICTSNNGQAPPSSYNGPACPSVNCGTCYRVDNLGPYGSSSNDTIFGSVIVEIVDACPAGSAQNYCKTDVPLDERCGSNQTNSLDIDVSAYKELTRLDDGGGVEWAAGQPNLRINVTLNVPCNGTPTES